MILRLTLLTFCLFCIGIFSNAQDKPKAQTKPKVENGADAIPITVVSKKKSHRKPPPPPPKPVVVRFAPPKIVKDPVKPPPPPPKEPVVRFAPPKIVKDAPAKPIKVAVPPKPEKAPIS